MPLRMRGGLAFLALLAAGCALDADNFPEKYANAVCGKARSCDAAWYDDYDDRDDCERNFEEISEFLLDLGESCTFQADEARDCLRDIRSADCDEFTSLNFQSDCDDVLDCF